MCLTWETTQTQYKYGAAASVVVQFSFPLHPRVLPVVYG